MATVHVAYVKPTPVNAVGNVVNKSTASIGAVANASLVPIVQAGANAPNATGAQSIEDYLVAEYAAGFAIKFMDQTMIVTDGP